MTKAMKNHNARVVAHAKKRIAKKAKAKVQVDHTDLKVTICDGAPIFEIDDGGGYNSIFRLKSPQAMKLGEALIAAAKATK